LQIIFKSLEYQPFCNYIILLIEVLLEEHDKDENEGVTWAATTACLKRLSYIHPVTARLMPQ
jgi:hypothetical protein